MAFYHNYEFYLRLFDVCGCNAAFLRSGISCIILALIIFLEIAAVILGYADISTGTNVVVLIVQVIWSSSLVISNLILIIGSAMSRRIEREFWCKLKSKYNKRCSDVFVKRFWSSLILYVVCTTVNYYKIEEGHYWIFVPLEFSIRLQFLKFMMYADLFTQELDHLHMDIEFYCGFDIRNECYP